MTDISPTPEFDGRAVHPALAVIPLMTTGELEGLAANIQHNGLLVPIMLVITPSSA